MSAYIEFFIRHGDDFCPIATYCRSDVVFQQFQDYVPYGAIKGVDRDMLRNIMEDVNADKKCSTNSIKSIESDIEMVSKFNAPIDEKMEQIRTMKSWIRESEEALHELQRVEYFIAFLGDIIEETEYGHLSHYEDGDTVAPNEYVYVGIEVGMPTIDDIKE